MSQAFKLCGEIDDRIGWVEALHQAKGPNASLGSDSDHLFKAFQGSGFLIWE